MNVTKCETEMCSYLDLSMMVVLAMMYAGLLLMDETIRRAVLLCELTEEWLLFAELTSARLTHRCYEGLLIPL